MFFYGASGHAKVCLEIAEALAIKVNAFVDDNSVETNLFSIPILKDLPRDAENIFISIGNNLIRKKIYNTYSKLNFVTLSHPKSNISFRSEIGKGSAVMAGATINSNSFIGSNVIINTNASIDHDCIVDNFVHISPNAALAGNVKVSEGSHIGIGATIIQGIKIGKWSTIGAGAIVLEDVPDFSVVVGNPGRIVKYHDYQIFI
jgi:acetyltransferase EpsM